MALDRGDYHYDDAGSWERACNHIATFLLWAAERGLASDDHDVKAMRRDATKYFISACDTKLWDEDFNARGLAFAKAKYTDYLKAHEAYARSKQLSDYDVPVDRTTRGHFFRFLDDALARFERPRTSARKKPAKKPRVEEVERVRGPARLERSSA